MRMCGPEVLIDQREEDIASDHGFYQVLWYMQEVWKNENMGENNYAAKKIWANITIIRAYWTIYY